MLKLEEVQQLRFERNFGIVEKQLIGVNMSTIIQEYIREL